MSKIRELLEIINRQNMVPSDSRYFDYERKLLNVIHAAVPELRALLAEQKAWREKEQRLQALVNEVREHKPGEVKNLHIHINQVEEIFTGERDE